jgi:hypothetical protein
MKGTHMWCVYHKHHFDLSSCPEYSEKLTAISGCIPLNFIWASLWWHTALTFFVLVLCLHPVSQLKCQSMCYYWSVVYMERLISFNPYLGSCDGQDRTSELLIWQHRCCCLFWPFKGTTYYPTKFHILLWSFTWIRIFLAFCKTRLMCSHVIFGTQLFESRVEMQCWILSILFNMCHYIFGVNDVCVWDREREREQSDLSKRGLKLDFFGI